jgi:nitrate reductase NapAB chaperone NapD
MTKACRRSRSLIESALLAIPIGRLGRASRLKLEATLVALEQMRNGRSKAAKHNVTQVLPLYDALEFCLIYIADLTVLTRDMACRRGWWETRLYARLLAITMLECTEDLPDVLGKKFRDALAAVVIEKEPKERISTVSRALSNFRKTHERALRSIRQIAAAHRDHNPSAVAAVIQSIDVPALLQTASDLQDLHNDFVIAMTTVFSHVNPVREFMKTFQGA